MASTLRLRRGKKFVLTPDGIGDITLSNNTINPTATQNTAVGTLGVFDASATPFSWAINNTKFELSSASGDTVTLERSATGSLTAGGTETVIVTNTDSEARVVQKQFTINVDSLVTDIFTDTSTVDVEDPSGFTIGNLFAVGGKSPVTFTNDPANTKFAVSSAGVITRSATGTLTEGSETLSVDATDANGNVYEEDITITVTDAGAQEPIDFATPDPPPWGREVTLAGNFPTTVTASNVAGISVSEAFATLAAYKSRIASLGGQIITNVPSGFSDNLGTCDNQAWVGAVDGDGDPASHTVTFETNLNTQSPGMVGYIKNFNIGTNPTTLDRDFAWGFTSGGTYEMAANDTIVGASSGASAKIISITVTSGSFAAGTAAGYFVLHNRIGTFTNSEVLNVGANSNVANLGSRSPIYGPRVQSGSHGAYHKGRGGMILVNCHIRNVNLNGLYCDGDLNIYDVSQYLWFYDSEISHCSNSSTVHNAYIHYTDCRIVRCVSRDSQGGMEIKTDTRRIVIVDSAIVHDSGEIKSIGSVNLTAIADPQTLPITGTWASGGVVTFPSGAETLRIASDSDMDSWTVTVTGTNAADAAISEMMVCNGSNSGGTIWSAQRFKTVTAAVVNPTPGASLKGCTLYMGHGAGAAAPDNSQLDISNIQDKRVARCYVQRRAFGVGGDPIFKLSKRTSKFGGHGPEKTPCVLDLTVMSSGNVTPWASADMDGGFSSIIASGLVKGTHSASATTLKMSVWQMCEQDNPVVTGFVLPDTNYDVRLWRSDLSVYSTTAPIVNATITLNATTNRGTISGLTGFGGTFPTATTTSNAQPIQFSTSGSLVGTGFAVGTQYYAQNTGSGTIGIATSAANAFNGSYIDILATGTGTHKIHCMKVSSTDPLLWFPLSPAIGGTGSTDGFPVAIKKSSDPWDTLGISSKTYNRADPDYLYGANGNCLTGGVLDFAKQDKFETGYYEDVMFSNDCDTDSQLFVPEGRWHHSFYITATFNPEFPFPPCNRPQGEYSAAYTSGGTYQILVGDTITGASSGKTAVMGGVKLSSGTWAGGDAQGTLYATSVSGAFTPGETLNVGVNTNVATLTADFDMDWPDVANAGEMTEPMMGDDKPILGRHPVGYVGKGDLGPNCDYVCLWPDLWRNASCFHDTQWGTSVTQFGGFTAQANSTTNPDPDIRYVNAAGALVSVTSASSPMPASSSARLVGAHSSSATKLYVTTTSGFTAGKRVHAKLPLQRGAADAIYIGSIVSAGSDGGGPFINVTPGLPRAAENRAEVAAFTPSGTPPATWIDPENYLVQ